MDRTDRLGRPRALEAFEASIIPAVRPALRRFDADEDEVLQTVRNTLFATEDPKISRYAGRGELRNWVRVAAVRAALKHRARAGKSAPGDEALSRFASPEDDPELAHMKQLYRDEFKLAFHAALDALEVRERNVLRHQVLDGLSIDAIGALYGVHRATAARWLARAREKLLLGTRNELRERLSVSREEFESIVGMIQSRLDVSLRRVLAEE